jgi:hypothetical protein
MKYKFEMESEEAIVSNSRAIPFALRDEVRSTIEQMLDDIIEPSVSCYLNPITVVPRPGKSVRICLDARRVNKLMRPDRTRVSPIAELLQQFHGSNFISTIDLSSAFLQVELAPECRKFTAFLFENQVYQFKRIPYGLRNSLAGFIRALNFALGPDTFGYVVSYVDDITVHSRNFEDHVKHLGTVFEKLTSAGFTINASKCNFCRPQITFLGHVIGSGGVTPDPKRIEAILNYPRPRNPKQLKQFLGVCNFHHRFIINYASYVAPLLPLLKQGRKWKWTTESFRNSEIKIC